LFRNANFPLTDFGVHERDSSRDKFARESDIYTAILRLLAGQTIE
jgi:hypothetical protein